MAAYLHSVDLNDFDPNAPPPHTESWGKIVASSLGRDGWLIDGLEQLREGEGEAKDFPRLVRADVLRELCVKGDLSGAEFNARLALAMARAATSCSPTWRAGTVGTTWRTPTASASAAPSTCGAERLGPSCLDCLNESGGGHSDDPGARWDVLFWRFLRVASAAEARFGTRWDAHLPPS